MVPACSREVPRVVGLSDADNIEAAIAVTQGGSRRGQWYVDMSQSAKQ